MDIKAIIEDVPGSCAQRWQNPAQATAKQIEATALIAQLDALKSALKQKKTEKQECARSFGSIKSSGGDLAPQKARMQIISTTLEQLEQQRKDIEAQLAAMFTSEIPTSRTLPQRFDEYSVSLNSASFEDAVTIEEMGDTDSSLWDNYVNAHPQASLYHLYCWRRIIAQSFGHPSFYLAARAADGTIHGVLPLLRLTSRLFGDFAVSVPFFNYGGPLADNAAIAAQLMTRAAAIANQHNLDHLEIRATHTLNAWPARTDKVSMIRALPDSAAALDDEIGSKVRAQIKRAQQEHTEINYGHLDLLDDFYRIFAINMRDLGTPVYSKQFFRNILTALPDQSHLVVVRLDGKPVAAAFLLGYRDMMEIPWASTLRSANSSNMNMLLYRAVLGFCIERGYRFFDFGRSSQDSGTFKFKKQWGAIPVQHYWHYWLSSGGELPALKPDSPKFRLLVACWKKLPVVVANLLGPRIVKNLP